MSIGRAVLRSARMTGRAIYYSPVILRCGRGVKRCGWDGQFMSDDLYWGLLYGLEEVQETE